MDVAQKVFAGDPWPGVTLVQVTLVAALGVLAWLTARRGGPALRGAVVLSALVGLLVVPALATVAPVWLPLPGITPPAPAPEPARPREVVRAPLPLPERPAVPSVLPTKPAVKPAPLPMDIIDPVEEPAPPETLEPAAAEPLPLLEAAPPATEPEKPRRAAPSAASILVGGWLLGAVLYLARALMSLALLYRCAWLARPVAEAEWADCLSSLPDQDGRPRVAVRESRAVGSPLTLGLFRSVILLPAGWRGWSPGQLRLVLAHELAHVRRRDFLAGLAAELAVCLCWFHPLVRWLAGRLRLEQEYAADARAAAAGGAMDYVWCLARLALDQGAGRGSPAPALWRRRPEILRRIDMLRRNRDGLPSPLRWHTASAVVALAAAACVAVAGIGPLRAIAVGAAPPDEPAPGAKAPAGADVQGDALPAGAPVRLGTTRWRHGSTIHYVAFGPEDKTLVTAGQDNTVRLWDMTTGQEIRRFARPMPEPRQPGAPGGAREQRDKAKAELEAAVRARALGGAVSGFGVAVSPDGKTIAVAGVTVVQLYEVATGKELSKISAPPTGVAGLLFSPDGKTLAGRATDGALVLWDTGTAKERHQLKVPPRPENNKNVVVVARRAGNDAPGMAFTPDGTGFVAATVEFKEQKVTGHVTLWDVTTGKELRDVKAVENAPVSGVAVAPGGKVIAYCSDGIVHACRADSGEALFQTRLGEPASGLTFSPDGKTLAVRGVNQQVRVLDAESGKELFLLGEPVRGFGGAFAVALAGPFAVAPEVRNLAFTSDGKRIVTAAGGTVRMWDAKGKELPLSDGHLGPVTGAVLSADGKTVVSWGTDRTIRRWDAATGKLLSVFPVPPSATATAVSADGMAVAVAGSGGVIRLFDPNGGKELLQFKGHPRGAAALAFSPDGKVLAERGADATVRVYDLAKGGEARQFAAQPATNPLPPGAVVVAPPRFLGGPGAALVFAPDGKLLATAESAPSVLYAPAPVNGRNRPGGTISLIDVSTGKAIRKIEPSVPVVSFTFSPDGRELATENADGSVSLWEAASGKERARLGEVATPAAPGAPVLPLPAVKALALGGGPGSEPGAPVALAFSPDGRALIGRGPDRSVCVWDVDGGKEVGRFKGHDGRVETVGFSPDGKTVVTGSADTTMLLWDAAALRKDLPARQAAELPEGAAEGLWTDLAGEDAGKAGRAVLKLTAAPRQAASALGERLKPADAIDQQKLAGWLADLESDRFAVRQDAIAHLLKAGEQAVPALQKVLADQPALETRLRVEDLLDKLTGGTLTAEQLRVVRAVEALEKMGTPEARAVLRALAGGAPGALPTREARAALDRLGGR
jgi:WD40 repeat protein/beta-lactamase regulating signal transducer with metallopeptidase domain